MKKRYTTALFSYKEWNYVICRKIDGTNKHIKRNKPISQSQTWQVFSPGRPRRERGTERNRKLRYMEGGKGMEEEIKWKTTKMIKADYLPLWRCKGTPSFKHFFFLIKKKKKNYRWASWDMWASDSLSQFWCKGVDMSPKHFALCRRCPLFSLLSQSWAEVLG